MKKFVVYGKSRQETATEPEKEKSLIIELN